MFSLRVSATPREPYQESDALRRSVHRGRPYGTPEGQRRMAKRLGVESAYRPAGRPGVGNRNLLIE